MSNFENKDNIYDAEYYNGKACQSRYWGVGYRGDGAGYADGSGEYDGDGYGYDEDFVRVHAKMYVSVVVCDGAGRADGRGYFDGHGNG